MAEPRGNKAFDLGVLFVHGIGEQAEGETLLSFGEPVARWVEHWLERKQGIPDELHPGELHAVDSNLTPSRTLSDEPPNAILKVFEVHRKGERCRPKHWVFAESWWGGDVRRPQFGRFARWLLTEGAWTLIAHATKRGCFEGLDKLGWARHVGRLVLWTSITIVVQVFTLLLCILAILPIPYFRGWLTGILRTMTGVLGDSFVLVESDLQRATIVSKTRRTIQWLSKECDNVVVVAHSQGAAVAHLALRESVPGNVHLLVTVGSGLGKLEELRNRRAGPSMKPKPVWFLPGVITLFAIFAVSVALFSGTVPGRVILFYFSALVIIGCMVALAESGHRHWAAWNESAGRLGLGSDGNPLTWVDFYASDDPVPNGPLVRSRRSIKGYRPFEVVNRRSIIEDHNSYFDTESEFVTRLVRTIDRWAKLGMFPRAAPKVLDGVVKEHRYRVNWLVLSRWAVPVALAIVPLRYGEVVVSVGKSLVDVTRTLVGPVAEWMSTFISPMLAHRVMGTELPVTDLAYGVVGMVLPLLVFVIAQRGYHVLWQWWDSEVLRERLRPRPDGEPAGTPERSNEHEVWMTIAALAPVVIVAAWPLAFYPRWTFADFIAAVGYVLGVTLVSSAGIMALITIKAGFDWRTHAMGLQRASPGEPDGRVVEARNMFIGGAFFTVLLAYGLRMAAPQLFGLTSRDEGSGLVYVVLTVLLALVTVFAAGCQVDAVERARSLAKEGRGVGVRGDVATLVVLPMAVLAVVCFLSARAILGEGTVLPALSTVMFYGFVSVAAYLMAIWLADWIARVLRHEG